MKQFLTLSLFGFVLWVAVTWTFDTTSLIAGVLVCALCALPLRHVELEEAPLLLMPHRAFWAIAYLPVLFFHVVKANLDVARRVLDPKLPIRPGIVRARTSLKSPSAKVLLANSITLTPGTLSVDLVDDTLYVHRIFVPEGPDPDGATERDLASFESMIRRIFE